MKLKYFIGRNFIGKKFFQLKPYREIFRFRGNLFFADTDIGKICWNDYGGNLLILENITMSVIIILY